MRHLTLVFAIFAMLALAMPAAADEGQQGNDDRGDGGEHGVGGDHGDGARSFGPYASASGDSGTCGPDWALDTFNRVFTVKRNADGSYTLREDFRNGKFVTIGGASPGACETGTNNGSTIVPGVRGEFSGYLSGRVTGGTFTSAGGCPAPCTGTTFLAIHFGPSATWNVTTFRFRYNADDEAGLRFTHWQNASPDQGGNKGDIAN